jgi:Ca2+-binding RTX toxin-like protein
VHDTNPNATISIKSIGLAGTTGFAYLDASDKLLTYTASGFNPNATQPADSFTYTATDQYGQSVTGTMDLTVTGPSRPTQVGTNLTANGAGQRLVGGNGNDTLTANGSSQLIFGGNGNDTITVNGAKSVIYGGTGANTIRLNGSQQTVVLQQGGTDNITGFNLHNGDVLDLTQVLAEAGKSFTASDFQVTSTGNDATLFYVGTPSFTGGSALAKLVGIGPGVTLQTLISNGVLTTS